MSRKGVLVFLAGFAVAVAVGVATLYSVSMRGIEARIAAQSRLVDTPQGPLQYAVSGDGPPALVIHGAGGGFDQGLLLARHLGGEGFTWIAPSRFGYLGTPLPADASTLAQADALAALLDELGHREVPVFAISGGVPVALQLSLRHPDRVSAMVLAASAPFTPLSAGDQDLPMPAWAYEALFSSDFPIWALSRLAPSALTQAFDVRPEHRADGLDPEDAILVDDLVAAFLPATRRVDGVANEGAAIDPATRYPIDGLRIPTLVLHTRDDGINPFPIAEYVAARIPGARLIAYDTGGHLMLGHGAEIRREVAAFLSGVAATPAD